MQVLFAVLVRDDLADAGFGLEFAQGVEHVAGAVEVFDEEELVGELEVLGVVEGIFADGRTADFVLCGDQLSDPLLQPGLASA